MYRRILVTLENSRTDKAILEHIVSLARLCEAEVLLVHVADGWAARQLRELNLADSREMKEDRAYLEQVRVELAGQGLAVEALLLHGEPADEIVRVAEEKRVDLIAMSTHGHRFIADLILGSTAAKVRHTVDIPVLLLKAPPDS